MNPPACLQSPSLPKEERRFAIEPAPVADATFPALGALALGAAVGAAAAGRAARPAPPVRRSALDVRRRRGALTVKPTRSGAAYALPCGGLCASVDPKRRGTVRLSEDPAGKKSTDSDQDWNLDNLGDLMDDAVDAPATTSAMNSPAVTDDKPAPEPAPQKTDFLSGPNKILVPLFLISFLPYVLPKEILPDFIQGLYST